jgi:PAS domain S-box-containing protein
MDRRLLVMFGLPPSDDWHVGFRHGDLMHPDDRDAYRKGIEDYVATGRAPWETQYRVRGQGGSWTWVLERGRIVGRDADGRATRMAGSCVDITERETAKIALAEAESRLRSLADTAPVLLWISGMDDKVELANLAFRTFYGLSGDDPIGDPWLESLHPDDREAARATYDECWSARRPYRIECRVMRHDGEYRWILETAAPRFGPDGAFAGYAGASLDITEQKEASEALRLNQLMLRRIIDAIPASRFATATDAT